MPTDDAHATDALNSELGEITAVLCDLDGVIWLAHEPIAGAVDAIDRLRDSGRRVLFVTNNSAARIDEHVAALADIGVAAEGDVLSSSMAAARLVEPDERVLVTGGSGIAEAVRCRGATAVMNDGRPRLGSFDVVMVGLDRQFDYARLTAAASALQSGARLIGTNSDTTYPTPRGLEPGAGSIVAAVAAAGESTPVFGGKPHAPMAELIAAELSDPDGAFDPDRSVMVGDRPETDGLMAVQLRCRFALVRTGVTRADDDVDVPDGMREMIDVDDLAALADRIIGGSTPDR